MRQRTLRISIVGAHTLSKRPVEATSYSLSATPPARPDRRGDERYLSLLRVGALLVGGRRELCLIRNISGGGMMIRSYSPIETGTPLSVELKRGEMVSGVAQWTENGLIGIAFDAPINVVALLTTSDDGPQPRMPRIELDCAAGVREDGDVHRARAVNISQGGIGVRMNRELRIGAHVIVSLAGLPPAAGVVKWKDAGSYGIGFNRVISVGDLMSFLQDQQRDERRRAAG